MLASGNTILISDLKKEVSIWNINSYGEFFMQIYEKYHAEYVRSCEMFRKERESFYEELNKVTWLEVFESQANYFLCRVKNRFTSHELALLLLKHNIFIKDCSSKKAFDGNDYIRIAIRNHKDNQYMVETLLNL